MNIEIPLQYGRSTKLASYACICVAFSFLSFIYLFFFYRRPIFTSKMLKT